MAVKASVQITISKVIDVYACYRYYKLQSSTLTKPSKPTTNPPSGWSDTEPAYVSGSTNTLYFVDCNVYSDGSFSFSEVSKSSSYEAAKDAWNKANNAQETVDNLSIGGRNLILNSKGNKKAGFFKHFNTVTDEYGEFTFTSKNQYKSFDISEGFLLGHRDYTVGEQVTWSYDIIYTAWNFPSGASVQELWMGQRYTSAPSGETGTGAYRRVTQHSLPIVGENGCELNKWCHAEKTLTIPEQASSNIGTQAVIQFCSKNAESDCVITFRLKNVKLERGNKATDWTPAPEDNITKVDVEYYLSTSATSLAGGSWSTTAPTWVNGKYMWSRTVTVDGAGNETYSPSQNGVCIAGAKGDTGQTGSAGKGVKSIEEQYYKSTSATSLAGGSWSTTYPGWESGKYIWTRSVITYTDSTTTTTTAVCVTGQKGETGAAGKDANQIVHNAFGNGNSNMYMALATFTVNGSFINTPIQFKITSRGRESSNVQIAFGSTNGTDPGLAYIRADGDVPIWFQKTGTSTWRIICEKDQPWGSFRIGNYYNPVDVTVTWTSDHLASVPSNTTSNPVYAAGRLLSETNASKVATNYMKFEDNTGLIVGDHTASTLGKNTLIDANGMAVRDGSTELARFGSNKIEIGKNSDDTTIAMRNGKLNISNYNRGEDYTQIGCYGNLDVSACNTISTENFKRGGILSTIEANDRAEWQHLMTKKWSDLTSYTWEDLNTNVFASELGTYFETRLYADDTDQSTVNGFNTARVYLRTAKKPIDNSIHSELGMLGEDIHAIYENEYTVDVYDGETRKYTPIKVYSGGDAIFGAFRSAGSFNGSRTWFGIYSSNADALANTNRKAWFGHDGSTHFNIQNLAGGNNYVNKAWTVSSDKRLKNDIEAIPQVFVDIWKEIEPKIFRWNELNYDIEQKYQFGIIAQDAIAAFEKYGLEYQDYNLVSTFEIDGVEYFNVTYEHYNMITSLALKSAISKLDNLEARIEKLEQLLVKVSDEESGDTEVIEEGGSYEE